MGLIVGRLASHGTAHRKFSMPQTMVRSIGCLASHGTDHAGCAIGQPIGCLASHGTIYRTARGTPHGTSHRTCQKRKSGHSMESLSSGIPHGMCHRTSYRTSHAGYLMACPNVSVFYWISHGTSHETSYGYPMEFPMGHLMRHPKDILWDVPWVIS